ncbi:MAG: CHAT domain-containing protein [Armatimonadetes bacterium]|nr:CHAT domain-containing protein [Armatimonadota bacterium]
MGLYVAGGAPAPRSSPSGRQCRISRAEALRQAQLAVRGDPKYRHPYCWASFMLSGDWAPEPGSRAPAAGSRARGRVARACHR